MFCVGPFDTDVFNQKCSGKVILYLDQALRKKFREIIDKGVDLKNPSLHLLYAETPRCDRLSPLSVDQIIPMRRHELVQRGNPPWMRSHFPNRLVIHVHRLFFHVIELKTDSRTADSN